MNDINNYNYNIVSIQMRYYEIQICMDGIQLVEKSVAIIFTSLWVLPYR